VIDPQLPRGREKLARARNAQEHPNIIPIHTDICIFAQELANYPTSCA
jgi:hypothetical protein